MRSGKLLAGLGIAIPVGWLSFTAAISAVPAGQPLEVLRDRCPTTRNLAPAEFADADGPTLAELDERESQIRGPVRIDAVPANAQIVLRAFAGDSITQSERSETATAVWRIPDGRWHFLSVDHYLRGPSVAPSTRAVLTQDRAAEAGRAVRTGLLDSAQSNALNALMADPCLEAEPVAVGPEVEVREGVVRPGPCFDGTDEVVEISGNGRRMVFRQYCHKFLIGDLLHIVLYPHAEDTQRAAREASWTIASPEEARRRGDAMIAQYHSAATWQNVTTTRTTELLHRPSGFRCAFDWAPSAVAFGTPAGDADSLSGRCHMAWRPVETMTVIRRELPGRDLRWTMMDAAPQHISELWAARPSRYTISRAHVGGMRIWRAVLPDFPRSDARQEERSVILGTVIDGWIVVQRTTGAASADLIEQIATREWQKLLGTRARPLRASAFHPLLPSERGHWGASPECPQWVESGHWGLAAPNRWSRCEPRIDGSGRAPEGSPR